MLVFPYKLTGFSHWYGPALPMRYDDEYASARDCDLGTWLVSKPAIRLSWAKSGNCFQ